MQIFADTCKKSLSVFYNLSPPLRAAEAQSCQLQMDKFRSLVGALQRWLQGVREQLPATEPALSTEGLETRVQELKVSVCLSSCDPTSSDIVVQVHVHWGRNWYCPRSLFQSKLV